jgi:hypothetical protein
MPNSQQSRNKNGSQQKLKQQYDADKAWCTMKRPFRKRSSRIRFFRRTICAGAAAVILFAASGAQYGNVAAQDRGQPHKSRTTDKNVPSPPAPPASAATGQTQKLPPRAPFTADDDAVAGIPGMPDARFWAESISPKRCRRSVGHGLSSRPAAPMVHSAPDCSMA